MPLGAEGRSPDDLVTLEPLPPGYCDIIIKEDPWHGNSWVGVSWASAKPQARGPSAWAGLCGVIGNPTALS